MNGLWRHPWQPCDRLVPPHYFSIEQMKPFGLIVHPKVSERSSEIVRRISSWAKSLLRLTEQILFRGIPMTNQLSFVSDNHFERDLYTSSQTRERALNAAILQAKISESFEEYLEIFDAFYGDDVEVSGGTAEEPVRGKARVRSLLFNFLVPLHVMAEVGGLLISIRQTAIHGDAANETHSAWTLDLVGVSGRTCTLSWCTLRKWNGSRVVYEHNYDHRQSGGPLTSDDLSLNAATSAAEFRRPS